VSHITGQLQSRPSLLTSPTTWRAVKRLFTLAIVRRLKVPASSTDEGQVGDFVVDGDTLYWHNGTQWLRVTGNTF